jgi:hypothetical protein
MMSSCINYKIQVAGKSLININLPRLAVGSPSSTADTDALGGIFESLAQEAGLYNPVFR